MDIESVYLNLWDTIVDYYNSPWNPPSKAEKALTMYDNMRKRDFSLDGVLPVIIEHPYHILKTLRLYESFTSNKKRTKLTIIKDLWNTCLPEPRNFFEFQSSLIALFIYAVIADRGYPEFYNNLKNISINERFIADSLNILINSWEIAGLVGYALGRAFLGDLLISKLKPGWTHLKLKERKNFYEWLESLHDLMAGMSLITSGVVSWSRYMQVRTKEGFTPKRTPGVPFMVTPTLLGFWTWRTIGILKQRELKCMEILGISSKTLIPYLSAISITIENIFDNFESLEKETPFSDLVKEVRKQLSDSELLHITRHSDLFLTSDLFSSLINEASIRNFQIDFEMFFERGILALKRCPHVQSFY